VEALSGAIKKAYDRNDWYDYVLKEKSGIEYAILDIGSRRFEDPKFSYLERFDHFIRIYSANDLLKNVESSEASELDLKDYVATLRNEFEAAVQRGIVGVKSGLAYHRILHYANVEESKARHLFKVVMESEQDKEYTFEEIKPLQDYIMHQIIQLAKEFDLPMVIHTGLQAGDGNIIENANPTHLANLFLQYRDVRFSLYHGGYPFGSELASLAKNFRNVYIDMCWLYIISPSYSERYLHEWLETVPANKIMAFGGDYHNVENVYGHSVIARQIISKVLTDKVQSGYITEKEAMDIVLMILRDNAISFYGLGK
jgi:predicted TIM-barrel fold metal-dependent hydrolase